MYLKLFNDIKNTQQSAHTIKFVSNEFIGYSKNPNELFSYNCTISDFDKDWEDFDRARFEIWIHPVDGSKDAKIIDTTKNISE